MFNQLRNRNFYIVLGGDLALFVISLILAYGLRYSLAIPLKMWKSILLVLPGVLLVKTAVFSALGVYRGMWRYTSIPDAVRLAKASALATLILISILTILFQFSGYPRSVFLADCIFTVFLCGGFRIGIRMLLAQGKNWRNLLALQDDDVPGRPTRLLIIGAGDAAANIIREIQGNSRAPFKILGCVDDNPRKRGQMMLDVPVYGPISKLPVLANRLQAQELLIAMPSVVGDDMRQVVVSCKAASLPFKTLPSLSSLVDGRVTVNDVREVEYEDLLGRSPVYLDWPGISQCLEGRTVVVTGAGGSIGAELCRQILRFKPAALLLIEANEFNLYRIEQELRSSQRGVALYPAMGRVQDRPLMESLLARYRPQIVFHAAACKHVPMVELNPWEAVVNNVTGSAVLMDVAEKYGVERFVLVSTDKAVRPTSVMGASKRVVEIILQTRVPGRTRFMAVRFGNVLGSSGSVVPLFQQQIRNGGPVTVTHQDITRYFMLTSEACQLILQAGAMGAGGEIFILEMGTPVRIADMARDMIRLSGKVPDQDIQIVYTGLRPGEKLHEELITHGEGIVATGHDKIMVLRRQAGGGQELELGIRAQIARLETAAQSFDPARIQVALQEIVPEYNPPGPRQPNEPRIHCPVPHQIASAGDSPSPKDSPAIN